MAKKSVVPVGLKRLPKKGGGGDRQPYKAPYAAMCVDAPKGEKWNKLSFPSVPPCVPCKPGEFGRIGNF